MDNITHSLIGAALGQAGLKRLSGLGMATLIIAANIPDIDATCTIYGIESLAMRRGVTHGPIAWVVLPLLLTLIMVGWDKWQTARGTRPRKRLPVRPVQLYLLALIGTLSHPLFDWFNNYGIRLLEPFSHRWFYGDTLFIIDVWIWMLLGVSLWLSRRRERNRRNDWPRPALFGLAALATYVLLNSVVSILAVRDARTQLQVAGVTPTLIVASPPPIMFWQREVFWRTEDRFGSGVVDLLGDNDMDTVGQPTGMNDPRIAAAARTDRALAAFLFWARMPFAQQGADGLVIGDQRFASAMVSGRFTVTIPNPPAPAAEPAAQ